MGAEDDGCQSGTAAALQERITGRSGDGLRAGGKGYGNAGAMESVEKQKQLFPSFHSPLEISQKARDSHIPTAWRRPGWKSGKPKSGFPLSHAGLATMTTVSLFSEQKTKKGDRPLRGLLIIFQDHLVLETESDFRIILRLENAVENCPIQDDPEKGLDSNTRRC
jgi:hypothetical protein